MFYATQQGDLKMAENKKAWKNSNTLRNSLRESSEKEYAIFSFDPEEVHDFFVWSGWDGGYAERFLIDSGKFESLEDAIDSLSHYNGLHEIQVIASMDDEGNITPLVARDTSTSSNWEDYEDFSSSNEWFW